MEKHHQESLEILINKYSNDEAILALLLGGSIAHGFSKPESDIDVMIIVDEAEYQKRKLEKKLTFCLWDICTYQGGYIDCKVVSVDFLSRVGERGSDPARYAFKDSVVLHSKIDELEEILRKVTAFPQEQMDERKIRFASQLFAWKWYYSEAAKKQNTYLTYLAIQKIILFSCRLVLNENKMLFPYHKWLLEEVKLASNKPNSLDSKIEHLLKQHTIENVNQYVQELATFFQVEEATMDWPNQFLLDSEWNWMEHEAPIDDL